MLGLTLREEFRSKGIKGILAIEKDGRGAARWVAEGGVR